MKRLAIFLMFACVVSMNALAGVSTDSTTKLRFQTLAKKMRLKTPELKEGEYEVRIWNDQALRYGEAQMLYILTKKEKQFSVSKYLIESDRQGFRYAVQLNPNPTIPIDNTLWEQFVQQGILGPPNEVVIHDQLFAKPPKDSTWNVVEADGIVSVKAKLRNDTRVLIADGEGYYFEVFSATSYQSASYGNPRGYLEHKPNIAELRKVVTILNKLAVLFRSSN
ncbi:hypothetical protein [Spirosoma validum]|uniref:Uncharacterized protein n=1 Tax=Spirosoma validum TaxID=2771355 RepID=A0A927GER3_9BACT|nr:hypothetical protein [Spirosoma validum]MBD2754916.1 hypothetical protein [Spirosoma validum]